MIRPILDTTATNWTGQTLAERLVMAADTLFIHGYLTPGEHASVKLRLEEDREDTACASAEARHRAAFPEQPLPDQQLENGGACT